MNKLYSKFNCSTVFRWWLNLVFALLLICCAATSIHAQETTGTKPVGEGMFSELQHPASNTPTIRPIRTDSPRETLTSFLRLRDELEEVDRRDHRRDAPPRSCAAADETR